MTSVKDLQPSHKFIGHHFSHPLDVVHLQLQQYNDVLINALMHVFKKLRPQQHYQNVKTGKL